MEEMNKFREKDQAIISQEQPETSYVVMTKPVKTEEDVEFKSNLLCSTSDLNGGSKSRQYLTEAEKDARRLRRILANRESARQTIRRRQAMFEELTRKAVDLALENDNLKKDKELAMQEYESLKSTNDCLKAQIAEMMKAEAAIEEQPKPGNSETSTVTSAPTTTPSFPCNLASLVPFHWPMVFQPSDASVDQCRMASDTATPLVPTMQLWKPDSFPGQGTSAMIANAGTLLYVLPFPCFLPFNAPGSVGHSQSSKSDGKENETSAIHQCNGSVSSKQMLSDESSLPLNVEVLNPAGCTSAEDPYQAGFGFPPDGGGEGEGICNQRIVLMPAPLNCVRPVASRRSFTALHQDDTSNAVAIPSTGEHTTEILSQENQEEIIAPCKKAVDAIAAAEARKRRKELIKLKNLHEHQ